MRIIIALLFICMQCIPLSAQFFGNNGDFLEQAFAPSKAQNTVVNPGNNAQAVGNEILREGVTLSLQNNFGQGCFINNTLVPNFQQLYCEQWLWGVVDNNFLSTNNCIVNGTSYPLWANWPQESNMSVFCGQVLWWDRDVPVLQWWVRPPLIVRITKFILRMTIVLAVTMVIFNGLRYVLAAWDEGKMQEAHKNLGYIIWGVILALLSLVIITLINSLTFGTLPGVG